MIFKRKDIKSITLRVCTHAKPLNVVPLTVFSQGSHEPIQNLQVNSNKDFTVR